MFNVGLCLIVHGVVGMQIPDLNREMPILDDQISFDIAYDSDMSTGDELSSNDYAEHEYNRSKC